MNDVVEISFLVRPVVHKRGRDEARGGKLVIMVRSGQASQAATEPRYPSFSSQAWVREWL